MPAARAREAGEAADSSGEAGDEGAAVLDVRGGEVRVVHCWEGGSDDEDGMSQTCMLPDGHAGPHEWSRDDQVLVAFPGADKEVK